MVYAGLTLRDFQSVANALHKLGKSPAFYVTPSGNVDYTTEDLQQENNAKPCCASLNLPITQITF